MEEKLPQVTIKKKFKFITIDAETEEILFFSKVWVVKNKLGKRFLGLLPESYSFQDYNTALETYKTFKQ